MYALKSDECKETEAKLHQEQMESIFQRDLLQYLIQDKADVAVDHGIIWQGRLLHCMHALHSCDLLSQVCVRVCLCLCICLVTKMDEQIELLLGKWTRVDPRNHVLYGVSMPEGEGAILGGLLPARCEVWGISGMRSIFSSLFGRWQQ